MGIEKLIEDFNVKFKENGTFELLSGESIKQVVKRENIPAKYGIYIYYGCKGTMQELIYIGKGGTITQNGTFRNQKLPKRLTMKQDSMYREEFFKLILGENIYEKLLFKWWITFDEENKLLPGFVEGQLMQAYYNDNGQLPKYNKSF